MMTPESKEEMHRIVFDFFKLMVEVARRYGARETAEDLLIETVRTVFATIREEERIGQW